MAKPNSSQTKKALYFKRKILRPFFLALIALFIIAKIVILSPASLEESKSSQIVAVDPSSLFLNKEPSLAPGIPKDRIAEYSIEKFKYVSIQNGEKQWRIEAHRAFMYNPERLVHARIVDAYLYDADGKTTIIHGQEARYFLNQKDLEVYGKVHTVFPDGFELYSDYLRYRPQEKRILIPTHYYVEGKGHENSEQDFEFTSMGLDYAMSKAEILLPKESKVTLIRKTPSSPETAGVPNKTTIDSDQCFINRHAKIAHFTMDPQRPLKTRFVHITQPTLFARSRRADLNYGNFDQVLEYLIAYEDVLVKEIPEKKKESNPSLRYATSGKAEFDTRNDIIRLTQLPQAYQDNDTVTGDIILMHKDSDIIEVEHSNAFSQGTE